jgi:hypothetical protein
MTYLISPDKETVFNALKTGQTLSFFKHDSRYGLVDVRIYVTENLEIVVSPGADRNASELESKFYRLEDWDMIWQEWGLEATIRADGYTLM